MFENVCINSPTARALAAITGLTQRNKAMKTFTLIDTKTSNAEIISTVSEMNKGDYLRIESSNGLYAEYSKQNAENNFLLK